MVIYHDKTKLNVYITSKIIHPNAHKSASLDALLKLSISGEIYSGVPTKFER